jgi:hypothetical protein
VTTPTWATSLRRSSGALDLLLRHPAETVSRAWCAAPIPRHSATNDPNTPIPSTVGYLRPSVLADYFSNDELTVCQIPQKAILRTAGNPSRDDMQYDV